FPEEENQGRSRSHRYPRRKILKLETFESITYFRASNTGTDRPRILSTQALARERQESRNRYLQHISGLSSSLVQILQESTVNPSQDIHDVPMQPPENEWEDVVEDIIGSDIERSKEVQNIIYDLRDITTSKCPTLYRPSDVETSP
ncbi:hypothetical protein C0995_003018, partial [Termitomyces sp. Mi166